MCCASTDDSLQLAVVQSVFRGAKLKDSRNPDGDKITRKMRVTKPAASPLPATSTARVRLAHLTWIEDSRYFACALSPVVLCDPCGCVVAEVPVKQVSIGSSKLLLWFSPEVTGGAPEAGRSPAKQRSPRREDATGGEAGATAFKRLHGFKFQPDVRSLARRTFSCFFAISPDCGRMQA